MSVTVTHGGWLIGPQHDRHCGLARVTLHRVSLDAFLHRLEAFAEPKPEIATRGMEEAVWTVLERHRGVPVPAWRLRRVILPCSREARRSGMVRVETLRVAVCHCRKLHPGERIRWVPPVKGYLLEARP